LEKTMTSQQPEAAQSTQWEALIERWWQDHFPGSAVARDTAAWNVAHAAKEALKEALAAKPSAASPAIAPPTEKE
jgi:hypothetical protein